MGSNKHFNLYNQKHEQKLIQELVEESIKIHSINAIYLPRENEKIDSIFREDVLSRFDDFHHLQVYIKNVDGFEGDQDIFKKFGLEIKNQITFSISRSHFAKVVGKELSRPREGDLIYIDMSTGTGLYEIRFVKENSVFFNLGEFYIFDVQCEQFSFQDEEVNVGLDEIDEALVEGSQTFLLNIGSGAGNFVFDEIIYQGDSPLDARARAKFVSKVSDTQIKIRNLFQTFDPIHGPIKGETSNAEFVLTSKIDTTDIQDDFGAQNKQFVVVDFTESNPFSEEE